MFTNLSTQGRSTTKKYCSLPANLIIPISNQSAFSSRNLPVSQNDLDRELASLRANSLSYQSSLGSSQSSQSRSMFINRPQQANNVHQSRSMFDNRPLPAGSSIFSYEDNPILAFQLNTLKNQPKLFSNPPPLSNYFSNNDPPNPTTTNQKLATMSSVLQTKEIPTASLNTMNSVTPSIDSQIKSKGKKKKQLSKKPVSKAINSSNTKSSFFYEKNKMLFVSRVVDLLNKHGMEVPEDLLDNSEFIPKFFEFLEGHNIHLPALDIPKFKTIKTQDTNEIQRIKIEKPDNSVPSSDDEEN